MLKTAVVAILLSAACAGTPEPVARGVCRVLVYEGDKPSVMECAYEGYVWLCSPTRCTRNLAVPAEKK